MKILLNCLPPADTFSPSISLSILKAFMSSNNIKSEIKYWNFDLSLMSEYTDSEDTEVRLIPFLSIINDKNNNAKGNRRIVSLLQKINPDYKSTDPDFYIDFLNEKKETIVKTIREELTRFDFSDIGLFGITAKFNQWIPGMILAEELKKIAPHVKVIVGGFGSSNVAQEALKLCAFFDYTTWGEGEYPLLELHQQLTSDKPKLDIVPRLFYRQNNEPTQSSAIKSEYLDFDNYIYPDFSDFIDNYPECEDEEQITIPINSIRSCHWHKCNFCDFNKGYKLRSRSPECIVAEIEHINKLYNITSFTFVDSDTFGNSEHFNKLLDLIIDLKYRSEEDFSFWAEIIPNNQYNAKLMKKMAIAGFKNLFIGYDGLSDSLLSKMNKSNTFSDNVFFIKHALQNAIYPVVNVIKHTPGETEEDVQECMDNLHFLRFFYNDKVTVFTHSYVSLVLSSMSTYYKLLPDNEKDAYNTDLLSYLLPDYLSDNKERFHLFRYQRDIPANNREWDNLIEVEDYYKTNSFSYKAQEHNGVLYYTEYYNDTEIENIVFGEREYIFVLKATRDRVISFDDLLRESKKHFPHITDKQLIEIITNLKASYLLYCNANLSNIISVIDISGN